ncbi:uncharacterized protein LOC110861405 [Folsomia candida]|uniref:uncharacterized protein LOC110861405 n=1 Tax=Folsomia candida TaxID=158441 RepID=UPI0016050AEA|nr:uncharacterized protein LOC110861405 [Folsomia candida]XP_035700584.1 uncharacterized protein LOC110861405 [Folsomia candida]
MFGSRRSSKLQRYPSADYEFHPGSDFELILTKSEFRPGEMVTFQVNARNGNAVRLNLYTQLMQTAVFLQRGKFSAEKTEVGSVMSHTTFCNMTWRDQIYIPPATQPTTKTLRPGQVQDEGYIGKRVVEISYSLILSTRVESVKLIRDEMPIKIVPWEVDNGVAQIYQSPIVATTIVATTGGSCNESRNLFPQAVPFNRSLLTTEFDNLPPHYSMLSLRSPFSGSSETLPPSYEDVVHN